MIFLTTYGLSAYIRKLAGQPAKLKSSLQEIIRGAALIVEGNSKKQTPVDTGRLRASITTQLTSVQARVGPHTNYATFVHEGTRFMTGQPFMQWGARDSLSDIRKFAGDQVRIALK